MNIRLINIEDIKKYKEISDNTSVQKKVSTAITEAQEFDLRPILGEELYLDIISKEPTGFGIYAALMNGGTYSYNSKTYHHEGIKAVLVYYAYARLIPNLQENATPYGFKEKVNEFSVGISAKAISAKIAQAVAGAQAYQSRTIDYLNRNQATLTLWKGNVAEAKTGGIKITPIGGNSSLKVGSSRRCRHCGRYSCYCND